jgi:signal transduction histidine kinase
LNNDSAGLSGASPSVPLNCIIANEELTRRPARVPDLAAETRVLLRLADTMAREPDRVLQELVENLCELCRAGSTGISLLDPAEGDQEPRFRWVATAGHLQQYVGHTIPRQGSPCGAVLDANKMLLMSHPERHFPDIETLAGPINEVLLLPFRRDDRPVGTIWVVSHCEDRKFDQEDVRLVQDLARFSAAAVGACAQAHAQATESLATLGHELRNIIGPLAYAVALLYRSGEPEVLCRSREIMDRQTKHLRRLIEDVLDSSRFASGKLRVETSPLNLNLVISQAVEMATDRILQSGQTVALSLPPTPLIVEGDHQRLSQVFANLLDNAAKYGGAGSPVAITVDSLDGHARISIRDHGIGIDQTMLPRIFDLFVQTGRSLNLAQGGLGLGLALVRQLVELHGGQIEAHSDGPGCGSEFIVYLPLSACSQ